MSVKQSLIETLKSAAKKAVIEITNSADDGRAKWAHISSSITQPVASALRAIPELATLEQFMYHLPNESGVIDLSSAAIYLTYKAQSVDSETLVSDLIKIATERQITLTEVRLLTDINPSSKIDLTDGFSLVPPKDVPVTEHSSWIFSEANQPAHGWGSPPSAALICTRTVPLKLLPKPKPGEAPFLPYAPLVPNTDWEAAMSALIVGSDGAPQFRQQFLVIHDVGWLGMPSTSIGSSESFPVPGKHASTINAAQLPHLFEVFRSSNSTIALAVKQLESSRRRLSDVERAIDFGVCVEVLLMSGSKDNGEISYKIATRAAWLIGDTPEQRAKTFDVTRALYNTRSTAAHTGALKPAKNMDESEARIAQFRQFDELCVSLIAKLAERGIPKDWKAVVLAIPES